MKPILNAQDIDKALSRIAHEILETHQNQPVPSLVGIRRRGEFLAQRLLVKIREIRQKGSVDFNSPEEPNLGILDINLYRDDLTRAAEQPIVRETILDFDIEDKVVILVDDVLYTGRTVRCALDALKDFGRPKAIRLVALIDRGHRELPIKADFVGKNIPTEADDVIHVHMTEVDGEDSVVLDQRQN
ncbi:MAG: pyrimidine operon attenuation protein/uracil phosphoribosyltransferase [Candidatus Omnitrophota bacterium]|jgi:pyrimidine operon attenuation protein/uracil phosphoribosyltransferase